jgi:hypothetical protein
MRRMGSVAAMVVAVFVGIPTAPAKAGGSTFDFHRKWFAPGQQVVGRTQFGTDVNTKTGRLPGEPYYAYLVRGDRLIEPPGLPRNAIRLGRVDVKPIEGGIWEASLRFIVPDVRPGSYTISLCNVPCHSAVVGDLMGAWISIAATAEQAKLKNLESRIADRVMEGMSQQLSDMSVEIERLRGSMGVGEPSGITVGTQLRLNLIEDRIERLSGDVRQLRGRADQGFLAWLWLAGWLVAAIMTTAWWRGRRATRTRLDRPGSGHGGLAGPEEEPGVASVDLDRLAVADLT